MEKSKLEQLPIGHIGISPNVKKPDIFSIIEKQSGRKILTTNSYSKADTISNGLMQKEHKIYYIIKE